MATPESIPVLFLAAAILPWLGGCGITGGTSAESLDLHPSLESRTLSKTLGVGSVKVRDGAVVSHAIGAMNWGRFDEEDLETLRGTLLETLPEAAATGGQVHVIVQHFAQTFTNDRGACLAVIDWCVADGRTVLDDGRFFTAYDTGDKFFDMETVGSVKERVLHASAQRVAERALAAVNRLPAPPAPKLTHDDLQSALAGLPATMRAFVTPDMKGDLPTSTDLGITDVAPRLKPRKLPPRPDWTKSLGQP